MVENRNAWGLARAPCQSKEACTCDIRKIHFSPLHLAAINFQLIFMLLSVFGTVPARPDSNVICGYPRQLDTPEKLLSRADFVPNADEAD